MYRSWKAENLPHFVCVYLNKGCETETLMDHVTYHASLKSFALKGTRKDSSCLLLSRWQEVFICLMEFFLFIYREMERTTLKDLASACRTI